MSQAESSQIGGVLSVTRDISAMISDEFETPFLFDIRHPDQYNRLCRKVRSAEAGDDGTFRDYWLDAAEVIYNNRIGLLNFFLRYITGNAEASPSTSTLTPYSTPGLTLVAAISASRILTPSGERGLRMPADGFQGSEIRPGLATKERAAVAFGGKKSFSHRHVDLDGYTAVGLHEIGHLLYLRHQFTEPAWGNDDGNYPEDHDSSWAVLDPLELPEPVPYDRCLMGYLPCNGDFCGKCHLQIRGWDISKMPI